jgi:hypothetical protein
MPLLLFGMLFTAEILMWLYFISMAQLLYHLIIAEIGLFNG